MASACLYLQVRQPYRLRHGTIFDITWNAPMETNINFL